MWVPLNCYVSTTPEVQSHSDSHSFIRELLCWLGEFSSWRLFWPSGLPLAQDRGLDSNWRGKTEKGPHGALSDWVFLSDDIANP